jgi:hypothetical protein
VSIKEDIQALENFSAALGCKVQSWGKGRSGLITTRQVAGENITTYFRLPSAPRLIPKEDKQVLRSIRSQKHRAHLRIITQFKPRHKDIEQLDAEGIRVTTLLGYFNQVLDSHMLASRTISNADKYIPSKEYVEQRVRDMDEKATSYIDEWLSQKSTEDASLLVILAPAGHGKTCLAHYLARQLANKHLRDEHEPIPFLMPLHFHRHVREFEEFVLDYLQTKHLHGITSSAFAYLVNSGRVVPILDGFDELAEMGGPRVARKTLRSLLREFDESSRSILTSRQSFFRHRGDIDTDTQSADLFRVIELDKFNTDERKTFFVRRGVPEYRLDLYESIIRSVSQDEDIPGNPLMLRLVVEAAQGRDRVDLDNMRGADLLGFCLKRICEREMERQPHPLSVDKQAEVISVLAEVMFEDDTYTLEKFEEWLTFIAEAYLLPSGLAEDRQSEEIDRLRQMLSQHALLQVEPSYTQAGRSSISFVHPVFRDYLIADRISKLVDESDLGTLRSQIRKALPASTKDYLADIVDLSEMTKSVIGVPGSPEFRSVIDLVLRRCDKASLDDIEQRTRAFTEGLGQLKSIENQDLSGIEFRSLRFEDFSFQGTNLSESRFQDCHFIRCDFSRALLYSARFFGCVADRDSADSLMSIGIEDVAVVEQAEDDTQSIEAKASDDPVRELVRRFLGRFVSERGRNKRTRLIITCLRGLGGAESHFTRREIIPEMCRSDMVHDMRVKGKQEPTLMFNNSWQVDADSFLWDNEETQRLKEILDRLRKKTGRYSLY